MFNFMVAAAVAMSISPSPPASRCIALGAMPMGRAVLYPNRVVEVSTEETSMRTRGRMNRLGVLV